MQGATKIIASDRGHLQSGVPRSRNNPWGDFVGTWDIPTKIPGKVIRNPILEWTITITIDW